MDCIDFSTPGCPFTFEEEVKPQSDSPTPFNLEDQLHIFDDATPNSLVVTIGMGLQKQKTLRCMLTGDTAKEVLRIIHRTLPQKRMPQLQAVLGTGARIHEEMTHKKLNRTLSDINFEDPTVLEYFEQRMNRKRKANHLN